MNAISRLARMPLAGLWTAMAAGIGCSSPGQSAPAWEPGVALVELLHGRPETALFLVKGAEEVQELKKWIETSYKEPPPSDQIGSVFPAGALMFSRPGDREFLSPPAQKYILYGDFDAHGRKELVTRADLDRLAVMVQKTGMPYEGPVRSGAYGAKIWEEGGSAQFMGLNSSTDAPFEKVKRASLDALSDLGFSVKKEEWENKTRYKILASRAGAKDGAIRYALIAIDKKEDQGCRISVLVRTKGGGRENYEADDAATWDLQGRIEKRANPP